MSEPFLSLPSYTSVLSGAFPETPASLEKGQAELFIKNWCLVCIITSVRPSEENFKPSSTQKSKKGMAGGA